MAGLIGLDSTSSGFDPGLQVPPITFGVWGDSGEQDGVIGSSNSGVGVLGRSVAAGAPAVRGFSENGTGVQAASTGGTALHARRDPGEGATATEAFLATPNLAADFRGDVVTTGSVRVSGSLGAGSLNVDPKGPGGIVVGDANTGSGGFTSLLMDISDATGGFGRIQAIKNSGSAWGDTALNPHGGNVGIGTTAPKARLHVAGVAADIVAGNDVNGQKFIFHTRAHAGGDFLHITGDDANGDWQWHKGIVFERGTGKVTIRGDCHVTGTINKSALGFKIDHPLDPANKFLCHSGIESDEMKNIYDGVADLDTDGGAEVALPDWFGALNRDFRYQLTAIGAAAPDLHVAAELRDGRFAIGGGLPGMKVCWQVSGVRHDAYAQAHPLQVEALKAPEEAGLFLHPEEHGEIAEHSLATRFAMAAHDSEEA